MNAQARAEDDGENAPPSYQTVRLSRGRHRSPEGGACVMELASMLKGRRFSDRVYCVDPAIMAFLWGYHDHISDDLRQKDLYRVAGVVLDTRRDDELTARRAEMCRIWALQAQAVSRRRLPFPIRFRRRREPDALLFDCELAGLATARLARADTVWHNRTLGFVGMLVWLGSPASVDFAPSAHGAPATRSPLAPHRAERAAGSGDLSVDAAKPWWEAACTTS
jgi:hypothetical protein